MDLHRGCRRSAWGDMSIVSYDLGDSLDAAHGAGFDSVGEIAVWRKAHWR